MLSTLYQSFTGEKFAEVQIWYSNFWFWQYVSQKIYSNDFLQTKYNNSLLDVFLDKIVIYYRNIGGSPNLECQFQVSEVIFSMKNGSKNFLLTRYISFFLYAFLKELAVHCRKNDDCPNLVTLFQLSEVLDQKNSSNDILDMPHIISLLMSYQIHKSLTIGQFISKFH